MACFAIPPSGNAIPAFFLLRAGKADFASSFPDISGFPEDRVLFTSSGSGAMYLALRAFAESRPDRRGVAVPAWCCPSVPQTVIQAGLRPVLVDMDPFTLRYDAASLERARRHGMLAVILVHFFGIPQPLPQGDWHGTHFLRDCAQDFEWRRDPEDPSLCVYSFGRGKALNAGHGGALCLPASGPILDACRWIASELPESEEITLPSALAINMLSHPRIYWILSRMPFLGLGSSAWKGPLEFARMAPGFHTLGSACLEAYRQRRDFYRKLVSGYRALLADSDGTRIFSPAPPGAGLPARYPVLVRDPSLREFLHHGANARFGGVTRMYPEILPRLPGAPEGFGDGQDFPGARRIAEGILTLPVTAELMGREARFMECLADLLEEKGALRGRPAAAQPERDWTPMLPASKRPTLHPSPGSPELGALSRDG
jgi:dTDP-4-amino-4,6-dideoxygalactose transaminase